MLLFFGVILYSKMINVVDVYMINVLKNMFNVWIKFCFVGCEIWVVVVVLGVLFIFVLLEKSLCCVLMMMIVFSFLLIICLNFKVFLIIVVIMFGNVEILVNIINRVMRI